MLAPAPQLYATVKQVTDEKGIIHIINVDKASAAPQNKDHNASLPSKNIKVVDPSEPTPSNIFPQPEEANSLASNPNFTAPAPEQ
jgi:hypothetical protein